MWPEPRGRIRWIASCMPVITPTTLMSSWRRIDSTDSSANGVTGMIPALLTTTSSGPS